MANLLSRQKPAHPFPVLEEGQRSRLEDRVRRLFALRLEVFAGELRRLSDVFSDELEELEQAPSLEAAHDLLDHLDRARRRLLEEDNGGEAAEASLQGDWLCYWPGRSLETGEAEIASLGFFDALDRPPLGLWVEAIGRRRDRSESIETAILCWIPQSDRERARAGQAACGAGTLAYLEDVSEVLSSQVREIAG